jgi:hypothetical protein
VTPDSAVGRATTSLRIGEEEYYLVSADETAPEVGRPVITYGASLFGPTSSGVIVVPTSAPVRQVDVTVEEWEDSPALHRAGGGFARVAEISAAFHLSRLRLLNADGSDSVTLELTGGAGMYRLRLHTVHLDHSHERHLLRLWPADEARPWDYQLDEDGAPIERPDRSATETLTVTMTAEQANTIGIEAQEMAILESQAGDIDDIVEDCLRISDIIPHHNAPAAQVTVALTIRQWKVALAVLDHRGPIVGESHSAEVMRRTRDVIDAQIGSRLPPGRVYGV